MKYFHSMHLPTLMKKNLFSVSGKLLLSDTVRNHVYQWAWRHLRGLPRGSTIVDIGSRDSLFPAFLAWRGFGVRVIERDTRFTGRQTSSARRWNVRLEVDTVDFLAATLPQPCDAVCSLFSLQHAGDDDIEAYRKAARSLAAGGLFLSATEYAHAGTRFHEGRDDGAMRIYGPEDIDRRIAEPLREEGMVEMDRQYCSVTGAGRVIPVNDQVERASMVVLLFRMGERG